MGITELEPIAGPLMRGQNRVLEAIARGDSLSHTLDMLLKVVEEQDRTMLCSILILDHATDTLHHGAAPSLPATYTKAIDGEKIGPKAGSCGTAAYRGEQVIVADITVDPLWQDYKALALQHGLRACWSTPIFDLQRRVLGTFALYFRTPGAPESRHTALIRLATSTAAIAIEQAQNAEERRHQNAELREYADTLVEEARLKNEFLAMLSHELRNPLAPIRAAVMLLEMKVGEKPYAPPVFEVLNRQIAHMQHLLDDLLDISRITRGRIALKMKEGVDFRVIVAEGVDTVRAMAEAKHHVLHVVQPDDLAAIRADKTRLTQVVINVVHNAVKYTDANGTIRIAVSSEDGNAVLRVKDTGRGISARLLPKIFDLFTQDDRKLDRQEGGLGIGLTLVKRITELHGGTVHAQSEGKGRGAEFVVCLPLQT